MNHHVLSTAGADNDDDNSNNIIFTTKNMFTNYKITCSPSLLVLVNS